MKKLDTEHNGKIFIFSFFYFYRETPVDVIEDWRFAP